MALARTMIAALGALMLVAADEPPRPPPELAAYVKDGRFDPGDFGWMRGAFPEATPEQKALFLAATDWGAQCRRQAHEAALRELAAMDIDASALEDWYSDCPVTLPPFDLQRPWAEFEAALSEARPIARTYIAAARLAQQQALNNVGSSGDALAARTIEEQMLRFGSTWGRDPLADVPALSPDGLTALRALLSVATGRSDAVNTAWLKARVAENGWPKISEVGERGAHAAWLLVQHADAEPVFQARALKLMEPLVAEGEVSKSNYAYLYDRIMLKLAGKQRYGTQWGPCEGAVRQLRPLEDEARLADLREEMGLPTMEEYGRMMDQMAGACGG